MISLGSDNLICLRDAAKVLPRRPGGRKISTATLYRWAARGVRGVRLETLRVGGTVCTTEKALKQFCQELSAQRPGQPARQRPRTTPTAARRRLVEIEAAEAELVREGIG